MIRRVGTLATWLLACSDPGSAPAPAAPATFAAPVSAAPVTDAWTRTPGSEPHPEARALYRRAVQLVHEGKAVEAEPLFAKITGTWPDSRFAARLNTEGLSEHMLGQAAAMGVGLLAFAVYGGLIDLSNTP